MNKCRYVATNLFSWIGAVSLISINVQADDNSVAKGSLEGITSEVVTCRNKTQDETIQIVTTSNHFNCTDEGITTQPGDRFEITVRATVTETPKPPFPTFQDTLRSGIQGPKMVVVPTGTFMMGSNKGSLYGPVPTGYLLSSEQPVHKVTISKPFAIGVYEVTQGEWKAIMGSNPSYFSSCGDRCPVEQVSWNAVQNFIAKLNALTEGGGYRLPTEAEWEYASRAGTATEYWWGNEASHEYANYGDDDNCCAGRATGADTWVNTSPVGSFPANPWGLFDTMGNVREWVHDLHDDAAYQSLPEVDPMWSGIGINRVLRGGSYRYPPFHIRQALRGYLAPGETDFNIGFRLAKTL